MNTGMAADAAFELVEGLKQLEAFLPSLGSLSSPSGIDDELDEEIQELEDLIAAAGEPEDEHSMRALTYLQTELARKRALKDGFF